ncbi:MAG: hypothetical protein QXV01_03940 [Candidatus Bathyarchaeia archaeon]
MEEDMILFVGARQYIQGSPLFQHKVEKYPILFVGEDVLIPLNKYEEDKKLKEVLKPFPSFIVKPFKQVLGK